MEKKIGLILVVLGVIALVYTAIDYMNNSASVNLLGAEVTVSEGSILPMIISAVVAVIGVILIISNRGKI